VSPAGKVVATIDIPVDFPSCPAFGGKTMDTLFVTSIRDSGTGRMVSSHQNAGALFAITGLGVGGIPETRFDCEAAAKR
jgi:sugar lactone lactonase YvrE